MLVLSRHANESIMVGLDIEIVVIEIRGDKVRLGISAPQNCPVHRREVYDAINRKEGVEGVPTVLGRPVKRARWVEIGQPAKAPTSKTSETKATTAKRLTLRDVLTARARAAKQKPTDQTP
jgi:carbon storage regulator